jgi:hypothetical protein
LAHNLDCINCDEKCAGPDAHQRHDWLLTVMQRLWEEFAKLDVEINDEKSRIEDLRRRPWVGLG